MECGGGVYRVHVQLFSYDILDMDRFIGDTRVLDSAPKFVVCVTGDLDLNHRISTYPLPSPLQPLRLRLPFPCNVTVVPRAAAFYLTAD